MVVGAVGGDSVLLAHVGSGPHGENGALAGVVREPGDAILPEVALERQRVQTLESDGYETYTYVYGMG